MNALAVWERKMEEEKSELKDERKKLREKSIFGWYNERTKWSTITGYGG